jgi:hypothetical protein
VSVWGVGERAWIPDFQRAWRAQEYAAYLIYVATHWMALMLNIWLFYRALCVFCGLLGIGIYIEAQRLGGWYVSLGIAALLAEMVTASLVVRRW